MSHRFLVVLGLALFAALSLAPAVPAVAPVPVQAAGFSFTPPVLVVPAGTTVQWEAVLFEHTLRTAANAANAVTGVANDPSNSDDDADTFATALPEGASFSHTFQTPGDYAYYCEIHRIFGMVGEIKVI